MSKVNWFVHSFMFCMFRIVTNWNVCGYPGYVLYRPLSDLIHMLYIHQIRIKKQIWITSYEMKKKMYKMQYFCPATQAIKTVHI